MLTGKDIAEEADGKAVFGNFKHPDKSLNHWAGSIETTKYLVDEQKKSNHGDVIETGLAAEYTVKYKLNGYNDWVLPTVNVFRLIKNSVNYNSYNFKLNDQYWCSNSSTVVETRIETYYEDWDWFHLSPKEKTTKTTVITVEKFRFEPELPRSMGPLNYPNFFAIPNGYERHYVRPIRFF